MIVTVFDTETTGLPASYILEEANVNSWPSILQFSFIVYDTDQHSFLEFRDIIVKLPETIQISEESMQIHGITREKVQNDGQELLPYLREFLQWTKKSELVVGHNVEFDYKMVCAELMRLNLKEEHQAFKYNKNFFCTMKSTVNLCNIKAISKTGREFTKFPTLSELHHYLFKTTPRNMHNAVNDILITFRCFYRLKFERDIFDDNQTFQVLLWNVLSITK